MTTTIAPYNYTPSVHIERDSSTQLNYINTPNTQKVFDDIAKYYQRNIHSISIVGDYGTGKSAFLWALKQQLQQKQVFFQDANHIFNGQKFNFISLVGKFASFRETLALKLGITQDADSSEILKKIQRKSAKKPLVIFVDEFGKFLEYASLNQPEVEMYFLQELAEAIAFKNVLFINILHQAFGTYSYKLSKIQRDEWEKVRGRIKDIAFNEPVERLLFLASEKISSIYQNKFSVNGTLNKLLHTIEESNTFHLRDYFTPEIAHKLLPLDILSASVLAQAIQQYGQNERSLFSFIENIDLANTEYYDKYSNPFFNLACVYDYLYYDFFSYLTSKNNPNHTKWGTIRTAYERVEKLFTSNIQDGVKLVKAIGILNIFSSGSAKIDPGFLQEYGKIALGIENPESIIKELKSKQIIRYKEFDLRYDIFEGTNLNIDSEIEIARQRISQVSRVDTKLQKYFKFPHLDAKAYFHEVGTPRLFKVIFSENPITDTPQDEIDGFINLVIFKDKVETFTQKLDTNQPILYGLYKNSNKIEQILLEIEAIKSVQESIEEADRVAYNELIYLLQGNQKQLSEAVLNNLFSKNHVHWFFNQKTIEINNQRSLNRELSRICYQIYADTPVLKNELFNRTKLPSAIAYARRQFLATLLSNWSKPGLDFPENKFPPEKSIYNSLLKLTGIHYATETGFELGEPTEKSFKALWNTSEQFLQDCKNSKRNLTEFVKLMQKPPFKLKRGVVDFWMPLFLFIKRDDYALYEHTHGKDIYIPTLSYETLDLVIKRTKDYRIKTFNVAGIRAEIFRKYREFLNQNPDTKAGNKSFIEIVRPFLTFYKQLPEYTQQTQNLSPKSKDFRDILAQANDPERVFFEDIPQALGFNFKTSKTKKTDLEKYTTELHNIIHEIKNNYEEVVDDFEELVCNQAFGENIAFENYTKEFKKRYKPLKDKKNYVLKSHQRVFINRITATGERKNWLNGLAQACIKKTLDKMSDREEKQLHDNFVRLFKETNNLNELNKSNIDTTKEEVIKFDFTSFDSGETLSRQIRIPKSKIAQMEKLEAQIKKLLVSTKKDKDLRMAILSKLLKENL